MDEYRQANRRLWNEWAVINARSEFYDVPGFVAGGNTLYPEEIDVIGDVRGRSLLHLQCHFGMDTLSWARLGATVTGADFSEVAIAQAQNLAIQIGAHDARFLCSDLYALGEVLDETFDVVYTSRGVLGWLPDIEGWGRIVGRYLKPGGTFYIHEFHPVFWLWDDAENVTELRLRFPYFRGEEPLRLEAKGSYADRKAELENKVNYGWPFTFSDVVNALIGAGLRIDRLDEQRTMRHQLHPLTTQTADGWVLDGGRLPVAFSILATKQ
jgi:SAM-dependent methyltransferase